jgi:hypothetical protein
MDRHIVGVCKAFAIVALIALAPAMVLANAFAGGPPSEAGVCESLSGAARGLCNAYCDAQQCQLSSRPSCEELRKNFAKHTGSTRFPCDAPAPTRTAQRPTPTATPSAEATPCDVTLTTAQGSELDLGWTGIAHNQSVPEDATLTTALSCVGDDCTINDASLVGTAFLSPLPLSAGGVPVCIVDTIRSPVTGTMNCADGCAEMDLSLTWSVFLVQDIAKPCPVCVGDPVPNDGQKGGMCDGGATPGAACDVGGTSISFGSTSSDCLPSGTDVGDLSIDLNPFTTDTITATATTPCAAFGVQGQCFCPGQNRPNGCDTGVCPASGVCETGPIDGLCSNERFRACVDDQDCEATFPGAGTCVQSPRPCFGQTISLAGQCGTPNSSLVSLFCVPATRAPAVNVTAGLPGPATLQLPIQSSGCRCER